LRIPAFEARASNTPEALASIDARGVAFAPFALP
jgi:hypothetical protein